MEHRCGFYVIECDFCGKKLNTEPERLKDTDRFWGYDKAKYRKQGWILPDFDKGTSIHLCPECAKERENKRQGVF